MIFPPLAFFVAIVLSIWFIWPSIEEVVEKTKSVKDSEKTLAATQERKRNVEQLRNALDQNKEKEDFILSYLPQNQNEEAIIDAVNYLASTSSVNLIDVSFELDKSLPVASNASSGPSAANPTIINNSSPNGMNPEALEVAPEVKFYVFKAMISGKYENIKIFIDQLGRMEFLNHTSGLSITQGTQNTEEGEKKTDILIANIEAKFGFLPVVKSNQTGINKVFSQSGFDFSPYNEIRKIIKDEIIPEIDAGQKGKSNPFLP